MDMQPETDGINLIREKSLHAALKSWYADDGGRLEVDVQGYVIDIVRDNLLVEIQTGNFSAIKLKLNKLLADNHVRLIYPIAVDRWIVKIDQDGHRLSRRKSPRRAAPVNLFNELVYILPQVAHPNFSLEIVLIQDEEVRCDDGKGSWRRKGWSIRDRLLLDILDSSVFSQPDDYRVLLPPDLPEAFTTAELAARLRHSTRIAQKMAYCLRYLEVIRIIGKRGNALVYAPS
jgi:hypothetical protein